MALRAVDLGANKEEQEEALYKTVMVTDRGQSNTLIGLDFKAERGSEGGDGRTGGALCRFARPPGDPSFGQKGVCLSVAIWAKRRGNFFVAFVALASVVFLFCCPAIP